MALIVAIIIGFWRFDGTTRWLVIAAGALIEIGEATAMVWWSRRGRSLTGSDALIGCTGVVVDACAPSGRVRLRGELWNARSPIPIDAGATVRVAAVHGLELQVMPCEDPHRS